MKNNRASRQAIAVRADHISGRGMRRLCEIIAIAIVAVFWTNSAIADKPSDDDIAFTKAAVSLLLAKDNAAFRERLDPATGQPNDDTMRKMSDTIAGTPSSIETISVSGGHNIQTGDGNSRVFLEYALPGKWVVVDAIVHTKDGAKHFTRFLLTPNGLPLREINGFRFFGKGLFQYLFLLGWLAVIALTFYAMVVAFRRQGGWRRWLWIIAMPLGLTPTLAMNWNTGQLRVLEAVVNANGASVPFFAIRYPMAEVGHTEVLMPLFSVSAPLIAIGYLIWQWRRSHRIDAVPTPADQAS